MTPYSMYHHFQLCIITYQTLSYGEHSYLFLMLSIGYNPRELRSSGFHLFYVPRVKTHGGIRVFLVVVPTLWNLLSEHVKSSNSIFSFRHHLKFTFSDSMILSKLPFHLNIVDELDFFRGYWNYRNFIIIIIIIIPNNTCSELR